MMSGIIYALIFIILIMISIFIILVIFGFFCRCFMILFLFFLRFKCQLKMSTKKHWKTDTRNQMPSCPFILPLKQWKNVGRWVQNQTNRRIQIGNIVSFQISSDSTCSGPTLVVLVAVQFAVVQLVVVQLWCVLVVRLSASEKRTECTIQVKPKSQS